MFQDYKFLHNKILEQGDQLVFQDYKFLHNKGYFGAPIS